MKNLVVTYDLCRPEQNYVELWARLRKLGATKLLLSVWGIRTAWTPLAVAQYLEPAIDANDRVLVVEAGDVAFSMSIQGAVKKWHQAA